MNIELAINCVKAMIDGNEATIKKMNILCPELSNNTFCVDRGYNNVLNMKNKNIEICSDELYSYINDKYSEKIDTNNDIDSWL